MRFGLVLKNQSKIQSNLSIFTKCHPNTPNNIRFCAVFSFFISVCGFNLDQFGFEHPYIHYIILSQDVDEFQLSTKKNPNQNAKECSYDIG